MRSPTRAFHRAGALATAALCLVAAPRRAPGQASRAAGCRVQGVWELVSASTDGREQPLAGWRQRKVVTSRHFMWMGEDARRDTLPLRTGTDSLRAYHVEAGSGTYTTAGNRYTERIDYFNDPALLGKSLTATCRIEGGRWYHSYTEPWDTTAAPGPYHHVTEVWRRVP